MDCSTGFRLCFYWSISKQLIVFIWGTTLYTHFICLWMIRIRKQSAESDKYGQAPKEDIDFNKREKRILIFGIIILLVSLGYMKYYNFFAENWNNLSGQVGHMPKLRIKEVVIPLGISFYTLQAIRMNSLIQNLVLITKTREIGSGSEDPIINVSDVIVQISKEYSAMAKSMEKVLCYRVDTEIETAIDESRFRQLIVILLDNAVKYCDKAGEINVVLIRQKKEGNSFRLIISNTYAEGDEIDCMRFFDRFYRADTSHNIDTGGFGIGLSIARSLCEQFGGSIRAQWRGGEISFICNIG